MPDNDAHLFLDFLTMMSTAGNIQIHHTNVDWIDRPVPIGVQSYEIGIGDGQRHQYARITLVPKKDERFGAVTFGAELELLDSRFDDKSGPLILSVLKTADNNLLYWNARLASINSVTVDEFSEALSTWDESINRAVEKIFSSLMPSAHAGDA